MVRVPFCTGKPRSREPGERPEKLYCISVVVGLSGAVRGVLVMSLAEPVALALVTALCGDAAKDLNADAMDALMEIANMIAGAAKRRIPQGQVELTVPTI